jgi:hypothetical protein
LILRAFGYIIAAFLCMVAIEFVLEFLRLFGLHPQDYGLFILVLPMAGVAWVASHGKTDEVEVLPEMLIVFGFVGLLVLLLNYGNWFLLLAFVAAYAAVYGKPLVLGYNYLLVRRPLEQQALKQQTLSAKLDADSELAEATLRHERARAALAEAEEAVVEAERTATRRR